MRPIRRRRWSREVRSRGRPAPGGVFLCDRMAEPRDRPASSPTRSRTRGSSSAGGPLNGILKPRPTASGVRARPGGLREGSDGWGRAVAIVRAVAADHVEHQRRIGDRPRERPEAGQALEHLGGGPGRDPPALRLDPDQVRPRGGDPDRAGPVGSHRGRHHAGRHRRRRASGGSPRRVIEVPRVARLAEGRALGDRPLARARGWWSYRRSRRRRRAAAGRPHRRCASAGTRPRNRTSCSHRRGRSRP